MNFKGHRGDLRWGIHDYPVTKTQKATCEAISAMLKKIPRCIHNNGYFCSQGPVDGSIIMGFNSHSVKIDRHGRAS